MDHTTLHTIEQEHAKTEFFNVCRHIWLAMVNIESFTCNTFIVIHIQILQVLIDKSMLFIIVGVE